MNPLIWLGRRNFPHSCIYWVVGVLVLTACVDYGTAEISVSDIKNTTGEEYWIKINPIWEVAHGDFLNISGTTNLPDGTNLLVTVSGPVDFPPQNVSVKDGSFNASYMTQDYPGGPYTIRVDDLKGHYDSIKVDIVFVHYPMKSIALHINPTSVNIGENVTITVSLDQRSIEPHKVEFFINGVPIKKCIRWVRPKFVRNVTCVVALAEEGKYDVDVHVWSLYTDLKRNASFMVGNATARVPPAFYPRVVTKIVQLTFPNVSAGIYDSQPSWSPDGRKIAFVRGGSASEGSIWL
jgi:hypothetical protein